jgi:hypothetical protein
MKELAVKTTRSLALALLWVCAGALLAGCGGTGSRSDPQAVNDLKVIGLGFHNFNDTFARGPKDADELKKFIEDGSKTAYPGLKDGRYVFLWNVGLRDLMKGTGVSNTVVAYEKDVPARGGPVLMGDASVRTMSAEEFKNATLAKPKGP